MNGPSASARTEVNAPPEAVYALVSDLSGMSRIAVEFERGTWLGGAREAAVGARFRGHNRKQYEIEPAGDGCHVAERTWDRRPAWFRPLANLVTGVRDRSEHNQRNMEHTLLRLKAAAEAARG